MMITLVHVAEVFLLMGFLTTEGRLHGTKTTLTMVPSAANERAPRPFRGLNDGEDLEESKYVSETGEIVLGEKDLSKQEKEQEKAEKQAAEEAEKAFKEAAKEAKKVEEEAEREAKKAAEEAEKEAKKAAEEAEKLEKMTQAYEKKMTKENEALAKEEAAEEKAVEDYIEADMMIEAVYANETKAINMGDAKEDKKMKEGKNDMKAEAYTAGSMSAAATENMDEVDEMVGGDNEDTLVEPIYEEEEKDMQEEEEGGDNEDTLVEPIYEEDEKDMQEEEENTAEEEIEEASAMEAGFITEEEATTEPTEESQNDEGADTAALARAAAGPTGP